MCVCGGGGGGEADGRYVPSVCSFTPSSLAWGTKKPYTPCGASTTYIKRKEGNLLFNDTLNTFYLRLYGVSYMVKDHSDSERENPLSPHGLLFPIISKGSFI